MIRGSVNGSWHRVADVGHRNYVWSSRHKNLVPGQFPDSNPYGVFAQSNREQWVVDAGANTINFASSLSGQTITLTSGQLTLSQTIGTQTIMGPAAGVTISGGGTSRVFQVNASVTASISGLTITGGHVTGGSKPSNSGGGLYDL